MNMNMLYTYIAQGPHWSLVLDFCNCSNSVFTILWKNYQKKVCEFVAPWHYMAENVKIFVLVDPGQQEYFPILNIIQKQGASHMTT